MVGVQVKLGFRVLRHFHVCADIVIRFLLSFLDQLKVLPGCYLCSFLQFFHDSVLCQEYYDFTLKVSQIWHSDLDSNRGVLGCGG